VFARVKKKQCSYAPRRASSNFAAISATIEIWAADNVNSALQSSAADLAMRLGDKVDVSARV
jgi:hypothetical protein